MKKLNLESVELRELNEAYNKALTWFFSYPEKEMSLNDVVEELEISKTTANKVINQLVKEGFLDKSVLGRTWRITCNPEHPYNVTEKIPHNLRMIYNSGIIEAVQKSIPGWRSITLFGSYRKGDDNSESDIDIAVEVLNNEEMEIIEAGEIKEFGYRKNVKVNLHVFTRNKADLNLFANIANGIVLAGFLEARP